VSIRFEWDPNKAARNLQKHEVSFEDELCPEYDLSQLLEGGVRGKYADRYREGTNLVLLAPDVAEVFPDGEAVNEALRLVMQLAKIPIASNQSKTGRCSFCLGTLYRLAPAAADPALSRL
jgi:hypothetical protein